jgi:hypothetical protein
VLRNSFGTVRSVGNRLQRVPNAHGIGTLGATGILVIDDADDGVLRRKLEARLAATRVIGSRVFDDFGCFRDLPVVSRTAPHICQKWFSHTSASE